MIGQCVCVCGGVHILYRQATDLTDTVDGGDYRQQQYRSAMRDRQGDDAVDQAQCPCAASPFPSSALSVKLLAAAIRSSPLRPDVTTTWSPLWGPRTMGVALKP